MNPMPRIEIEDLLANEAWLRALVKGMLQEANDADDIVQETLVAALRARPRKNQLRSWLAAVARNAVRGLRRTRRRRHRRESMAAHSEAIGPGLEALERTELRLGVAQAVFDLPDVNRDTILLVYYLSKTPAEVAALHEVSLNTVYYRLHRSYVLLQKKLEERYPAWHGLVVLLAAAEPPESAQTAVIIGQRSGDASAPAVSPSRSTSAPVSGTSVARRLAMVVVLLIFVLLVPIYWLVFSGGSPDSDRVSSRVETGAEPDVGPTRAPRTTEDSSGKLAPVSTLAQVPEQRTIQVLDAGHLGPIAGATVAFSKKSDTWTRFELRDFELSWLHEPEQISAGKTNAAGQAQVSLSEFRWQSIWIRATGYSSFQEQARFRTARGDYTFHLRRASNSTVTIRDEAAKPMVDLAVEIVGSSGHVQEAVTTVAGQVEFRWEDRAYAIRVESNLYQPVYQLLSAPETTIDLSRGRSGKGKIVDTDGHPVSACLVTLRAENVLGESPLAIEKDGTFVTPRLGDAGSVRLVISRSQYRTSEVEVQLPWGRTTKLFPLTAESRPDVAVQVRDPAGKPTGVGRVSIYPHYDTQYLPRLSEVMDADGRASFEKVPNGRHMLVVESTPFGIYAEPFEKQLSSKVLRLEAKLPIAEQISGRITLSDGAPASGVQAMLFTVVNEKEMVPLVGRAGKTGEFMFESYTREPSKSPNRSTRTVDKNAWFEACDRARSSDGYVLVVPGEHILREVNGSSAAHNFWPVLPEETHLEIVLDTKELYPLRWSLVSDAGTVRTSVIMSVASNVTGAAFWQKVGMSADPATLVYPEPCENYLYCVRPRGYRIAFGLVPPGSDRLVMPVTRIESEPRPVRLQDADGRSLSGFPLFARPLIAGVALHCRVYLGQSTADGRIEAAEALSPGEYEFLTLQQPVAVPLYVGQYAPQRLPYVSCGEHSVHQMPETIDLILEPTD